MSRSSWKPYFKHNDLYVQQINKEQKDFIVIKNRSSRIIEDMLGYQVHIYNGIRFFSVVVNQEMIGRCFGEFAFTRKKPIHKKKKKK